MGVWKSVAQNVGNLAKHVASQLVQEPIEIVKNAAGVSDKQKSENQGMQAMEQGQTPSTQGTTAGAQQSDNNPMGFKTVQDYQKYQQLSGHKDEMELAILRKQLFSQYGLDTNVESGMQKARMEFEQKEKERKQVEEKKKEEKKMMDLQVKKQEEDMAVKAAREGSSAENKAWGAG